MSEEKKSTEERIEARKALLQLLLIILVAVGIIYLGINIGWTVVLIVLWALGNMFGVA